MRSLRDFAALPLHGELPPEVAAAVRKRRPDVDPAELVAAGWDQLHRQLARA